jgi:pyruvate/2-oxoglutarate dehydrogenase complex dihydrolipoamide acyltransferase (E2) component
MHDEVTVLVPRLNPNDDHAIIAAWLVPIGEYVSAGQPIATLETTKVTFDVSAHRPGYLFYEHEVKSVVAVGSALAQICAEPHTGRPADSAVSGAGTMNGASPVETEQPSWLTRKARRRMLELRVPPEELPNRGFIGVADIERIAEIRSRAQQAAASESWESLEQSTSKIIEAARLAEVSRAVVPSIVAVPVCCGRLQTKLLALRDEAGPVSVLELVIHEAAIGLSKFRDLNGFFADGRAWAYREVAIGFAVNTMGALKVPVVRRASDLSQLEVCRVVREMMLRAFRGELAMNDVSGGTFTITDLSGHRVNHFVPVLNHRQSAILGICAAAPGADYQNIVLAFDHRMSDGLRAAEFLHTLLEGLEG